MKKTFQIGEIGLIIRNFTFIVVIQMKPKKLNLSKIKLPKVKLPKVKMPSVKSLISKNREKPSKPFIDDVKSIFRTYRGQMIWISVLSGFLLFLLNILI